MCAHGGSGNNEDNNEDNNEENEDAVDAEDVAGAEDAEGGLEEVELAEENDDRAPQPMSRMSTRARKRG